MDALTNVTNATNFRQNIFSLLEQTIRYNQPLTVTTKDGTAVVLSEDDYRSLLETVNLLSVRGMKEKLLRGAAEPLDDCLSECEVDW